MEKHQPIAIQIQDRSSVRLSSQTLRRVCARALSELGFPEAGLQLSLVSERRICALHEELFQDPSSTNVISLEYGPPAYAGDCMGLVYVCPAVARREAVQAGMDPAYRVGQLVLHGIAHVCGYEHVGVSSRERRRMEAVERKLARRVLDPLMAQV